jgi:hypothetical protein
LPPNHYVTTQYTDPFSGEVYTDYCLERLELPMIGTDASGMRRNSFPSHQYVAKQYNDPVSGIVNGNICLEEIMSEQFIVGQQVRVQYGTGFTELCFPAVIHLKNSDGTYQITYIDLDESDPMASKKSPERIKAFYDGHCSYDNDYSGQDEDSSDVHDKVYSDNDHHEDDYLDYDYTDDDDYKIIDRRPRKPGVLLIPSSDQVMELSRRSSPITKFSARRGTVYHPVRSRLPVDTTVVVKWSSDGLVLTGVLTVLPATRSSLL